MNAYKLDLYSKKFQIFFLYIFILTPIVVFFSKFLADFFLSIVSIYGFIYLVKNKKFELLKYFLFFFIFIFFISLNLLIQRPDFILFIKSFLLVRFPLFMLFPFILFFWLKVYILSLSNILIILYKSGCIILSSSR